MALTEERLAEIEANVTWFKEQGADWREWVELDDLDELLAEVKRLRQALESIRNLNSELAEEPPNSPGYLAWHMADLALSEVTP